MKTTRYLFPLFLFGMISQISYAQNKTTIPMIKEENIVYMADGKTFNGFVAYPENIKGKLPGILIIHEWWGLTDYPKNRARQLAKMGYIAMAADPKEAQALTMPFYNDPELAKSRMNATHAFTNPGATKIGKQFNMPIEYNAAADKASWNDLTVFLDRIFKKQP